MTTQPRTWVEGAAGSLFDLDNLPYGVFTRGGEEMAVTALHHVLTCAQIDNLLATAGFVDIAHYAGPDGEPFRLGAPRLLLTARRR